VSREHEVRLPDRFWRHATHLSLGAKGLYAILLTFVDYATCETHVGNDRLERESGYARDKVKALISELEANGFIERKRLYVGNLKSKRILRCLKFLSIDGISAHRADGRVFGQPKISPISLPSHSHPSPIQKPLDSSEPFPEPETSDPNPERIM
jgi:hypothetical protein